jgi:hypothetical protein
MKTEGRKALSICSLCCVALALSCVLPARAQRDGAIKATGSTGVAVQAAGRRAPLLGADMTYADGPHVLIEGWQDKQKGDAMTEAF